MAVPATGPNPRAVKDVPWAGIASTGAAHGVLLALLLNRLQPHVSLHGWRDRPYDRLPPRDGAMLSLCKFSRDAPRVPGEETEGDASVGLMRTELRAAESTQGACLDLPCRTQPRSVPTARVVNRRGSGPDGPLGPSDPRGLVLPPIAGVPQSDHSRER